MSTYVKQLERMLDEGYLVEYIDSDDEDGEEADPLLKDSVGNRSQNKSRADGETPPPNPFVIKMREALARMFQRKMEEAKMKEKRIRHQMRQSLKRRLQSKA